MARKKREVPHSANRKEYAPERVLESYRSFIGKIQSMTEAELGAALAVEAARESPRKEIVSRLHTRFTRLRKEREQREFAALMDK